VISSSNSTGCSCSTTPCGCTRASATSPRRRTPRPRQGHQSRTPSRTGRRPPAAPCHQP
jgi:hypothetical protein